MFDWKFFKDLRPNAEISLCGSAIFAFLNKKMSDNSDKMLIS